MKRELTIAESPATYEVHVNGPLPASLRAAFPNVTASPAPAETVLVGEVLQGTELDVLLDQLLFMGLVLSEVHERPATPPLPRDETTIAYPRRPAR